MKPVLNITCILSPFVASPLLNDNNLIILILTVWSLEITTDSELVDFPTPDTILIHAPMASLFTPPTSDIDRHVVLTKL